MDRYRQLGRIYEIHKRINMILKKRIFLFVSLLYILYTIVPIVQDVTGFEVRMVNLTTFLILFVLFPRAYTNLSIYWFLVYATILAIYVLFGKPLTIGIGSVGDSKKIFIEYAFFLPSLSIFSILFYLKDNRLYKIISVAAILSLTISFIYMMPQLLSNSNILRLSVAASLEGKSTFFGMPSYSLMHAYVLLLPAFLFGFRIFKSWQKWGMLLVLALLLFIIVNTYITTSLVIALIIVSFTLLFDIHNMVRSIIFIILLFFIIYILHISDVFIQIFNFLIAFFDGTDAQSKMEDFKLLYLTGEIGKSSNLAGRSNLHNISWSAFFDNILFGSSPVGGHSSLIDRLGGMGLLAFIPFIMII